MKCCINKLKYKLFKDNRVALIKLEGIIIDASNMPVVTRIIEALDEVKKQKIKSVVLRINSPGGSAVASQEIYSAIRKAQKDGIKVIASLGDVAASGGVYVAVACDKVVSNLATVTGSIGVIIKTSVVKELYKKIGIDYQIIKSGAHKDILSNTKYLTEEERAILQQLTDTTYDQFIEIVATSRNIDIDTVKSFADGRIFSGSQAKNYGLVDEIGTQSDAVNLAAELVGIEGEPKIINMTPKKSFFQKVIGMSMNQLLDDMKVNSIHSGVPLWLMPKF